MKNFDCNRDAMAGFSESGCSVDGRHECGWCGKRIKTYTVTNGFGDHQLLNPHKDRNGDRCLHSDALLKTSQPNDKAHPPASAGMVERN